MKKSFKSVVSVLLTLLAVAAIMLLVMPHSDEKSNPALFQSDTHNDTQSKTAPGENRQTELCRVRMMCAGDNLIHSGIYRQAHARAGGSGYDFTYAYENVAELLSHADFAVLNQETVIDSSREPSNFPLFNSPPELGRHMVSLGFNVINHANNHVLDQGVGGAQRTIDFWHSIPGVLLTGLYSDSDDMESVKTNTVNGISFAHIGVTEYLNGMQLSVDSPLRVVSPVGAGMTRSEFYATAEKMIKNAKMSADVVCVSAHFQQENITQPSQTQLEIVSRLVEMGADVIIGTGPHVLQRVEFVERADGTRALVMYSLGNFISAQADAVNLVSAIADIQFVKNEATQRTVIDSAGLVPIVTHYGAGYSDIHLELFGRYGEEKALAHGVRQRDPDFSRQYIGQLLSETIGDEFIIFMK